MGFTDEMSHLADDLVGSFDSRVKFLGHNVADVKHLRREAQKTVERFRKEHRTMGRKLRSTLGAFMEDLRGTVKELRDHFSRDRAAIQKDLRGGHRAFQRMAKTLAERRQHFQGDLKKAAEKFAHAR